MFLLQLFYIHFSYYRHCSACFCYTLLEFKLYCHSHSLYSYT
uniref:Uncharacterized protein n=1 Tax=Ciona intestinalis TaxID=7719 RepID=H2XP96_CIOIN